MKLQLGLNLMFAGLLAASSHAQVLHYDFNDPENGTSTVSIGSNTATANFRNSANTATNLHGAAGSGVSGLTGDLAFDNTASTGMGSAGTGGYAVASIGTAMDNVTSFTISGWFKSDTVIGNAARIMEQFNSATSYWRLLSDTPGRLTLQLATPTMSSTGVTSAPGTAYTGTNEWIFFAVTYDGTVASNNVRFYVGGVTSGVSQVGSALTLNGGTLGVNTANLTMGGGTARPYDGFLDDIRIYNATSGNGGVLSLEQLEAVRYAAIPEPSALTLLALAVAYMGLTRRRKN